MNCSTCSRRVIGHAYVTPHADGDRILCSACTQRAAEDERDAERRKAEAAAASAREVGAVNDETMESR